MDEEYELKMEIESTIYPVTIMQSESLSKTNKQINPELKRTQSLYPPPGRECRNRGEWCHIHHLPSPPGKAVLSSTFCIEIRSGTVYPA